MASSNFFTRHNFPFAIQSGRLGGCLRANIAIPKGRLVKESEDKATEKKKSKRER